MWVVHFSPEVSHYREGDPTWIDIANDRKLWTSLVYELFHDAKNY